MAVKGTSEILNACCCAATPNRGRLIAATDGQTVPISKLVQTNYPRGLRPCLATSAIAVDWMILFQLALSGGDGQHFPMKPARLAHSHFAPGKLCAIQSAVLMPGGGFTHSAAKRSMSTKRTILASGSYFDRPAAFDWMAWCSSPSARYR
jgi:hypothetical protein